jgi:hypothetical protein
MSDITAVAAAPAHDFKVGDTVCRIEDREQVRATVLEIISVGDEDTLHISYHEGGNGYWSASSLRKPTAEEAAAWGL